jgi:hypothetical protein
MSHQHLVMNLDDLRLVMIIRLQDVHHTKQGRLYHLRMIQDVMLYRLKLLIRNLMVIIEKHNPHHLVKCRQFEETCFQQH